MSEFNQFEGIDKLFALIAGDRKILTVLAAFAESKWNGNVPAEFELKNKGVITKGIKANIILHGTEGISFQPGISFDFFYSIHFAKILLDQYGDDWIKINKAAWKKLHREKSPSGQKLSPDFVELLQIVFHHIHGIDFIEVWSADIAGRFLNKGIHVERILPYCNLDLTSILGFIKKVTVEASNSINTIAAALSEIARVQPVFGELLLNKLNKEEDDAYVKMIPAVILGLAKARGTNRVFSMVLEQLTDSKQSIILNGLFIFSNVSIDRDCWTVYGEPLMIELAKLKAQKEPLIHIHILNVLRNIYSHTKELGAYIVELSLKEESVYKDAVSQILWAYKKEYAGEDWYATAFLNLDHFDMEKPGLADQIEWTLSQILETDPDLYMRYMDKWIAHPSNDLKKIEVFENSIITFFGTHHGESLKWMTLCFRSPDERFHRVMQNIVSILWVADFKHLELHQETLNASSLQLIQYILFKILAYVHSKEHLQSLVYSILTRDPEHNDITLMIRDAFLQHITYHYGGANNFLREKLPSANNAQKIVIENVLAFNNKYNADIKDLQKIKELKLQNTGGINFFERKMKRMSQGMQKGLDKQRKNSIMNYVKKIEIKAGHGFFSKHDDHYNEPSKMGHFSSSFEMPIGESIDGVKERLNMLKWKQFKYPA